jgi:hypothetical protein
MFWPIRQWLGFVQLDVTTPHNYCLPGGMSLQLRYTPTDQGWIRLGSSLSNRTCTVTSKLWL